MLCSSSSFNNTNIYLGAGTTPFSRGFDGRAVLRSSVREFLVSEAMYHLGVPTTRALSLVVSQTEKVQRVWYSQDVCNPTRGPNVLIQEPTAITCRVSPSFLRVGHVQLFERRVKKSQKENLAQLRELFMIVRHCIFREYPEVVKRKSCREIDLDRIAECDPNWRIWKGEGQKDQLVVSLEWQQAILDMLREASTRFAALLANWIRVGYCQGNYNSDNSLVGGRTMDYGPFGFIEKFSPLWNCWVASSPVYGFLNQPNAGHMNFGSFAKAVLPLLDLDGIFFLFEFSSRISHILFLPVDNNLVTHVRAKAG